MKLKDIILIVIISILTGLLIFEKFSNKKETKVLDNTELLNKIENKLDSIKSLNDSILLKEVNIKGIESRINVLNKKIDKIDETLKKDTINVNSFTNFELDSFFRARYPQAFN